MCNGIEMKHSCEADCAADPARRPVYALERQEASRLFASLAPTEHPAYHCHESYSREGLKRWDLPQPSKDLRRELTAMETLDLRPGAHVLELGCGNGRDVLFMASRGFRATGVDLGEPAIARARIKAREGGLDAEFLVWDVLQLPEPESPVSLVYDNTIYCNLRLEFLEQVLQLLERLTAPGTWYMLNCANANHAEVVGGYPRLREADMRRELGGLFEFVRLYEGIHDVNVTGINSEWHERQGGVVSWTALMRRKAPLPPPSRSWGF